VEKTLEVIREKGWLYEEDGALWIRTSLFAMIKTRRS